jgi:hypothetical protein
VFGAAHPGYGFASPFETGSVVARASVVSNSKKPASNALDKPTRSLSLMDPARIAEKVLSERTSRVAPALPFSTSFDDMVDFYRLMSPADLKRAAEGTIQNERWFGGLQLGYADESGNAGSWVSYKKIADAIAEARGLPKVEIGSGNRPFPTSFHEAVAGYERYLAWESFMPAPLRTVRSDLAKLNAAFQNRLYVRQNEGAPISVRTLIEAIDAAQGG